MNKKIIAIIIAVIVILLGIYQFVYVPYQNEEAIKNYNAGLQNVSAMDKEFNESATSAFNNLNSSDVSGSIEITTKVLKDSISTCDKEIEKLNETRTYANGNKTKEDYIDYQIQIKQIEKELSEDMIPEYDKMNEAIKNTDLVSMMNASNQLDNIYNAKVEEVKPVRDNVIKLLNDNPDFNQTLRDLNLTEDFYAEMNLTAVSS